MYRAYGLTIILALLLGLTLPLTAAAAGDISISSALKQSSVPFDGTDTLEISIIWRGEPFQYVIDSFPLPALDKLQILGSSSSVSTSQGPSGAVTSRLYRYILCPTDYGTGVIAPLNLTAKDRITGELFDLKTTRLTVEISKPTFKTKKEGISTALWVVLSAVVIMIGAAVLYILWRRRTAGSLVTPNMTYLESLDQIRRDAVADRKLFFSRLFRLLITFLEKEKGMVLSGKTGEEIVELIEKSKSDSDTPLLAGWLAKIQREKYLPEAPSSGEVETTYQEVRQFLERKLTT